MKTFRIIITKRIIVNQSACKPDHASRNVQCIHGIFTNKCLHQLTEAQWCIHGEMGLVIIGSESIVNGILRRKFRRHWNQSLVFLHRNALENVHCNISFRLPMDRPVDISATCCRYPSRKFAYSPGLLYVPVPGIVVRNLLCGYC